MAPGAKLSNLDESVSQKISESKDEVSKEVSKASSQSKSLEEWLIGYVDGKSWKSAKRPSSNLGKEVVKLISNDTRLPAGPMHQLGTKVGKVLDWPLKQVLGKEIYTPLLQEGGAHLDKVWNELLGWLGIKSK